MTASELKSWDSIKTELMRRISTHEWAPGDPIPAEERLAEEFGCARATVHRALRELSEAGLIERRRRAGSRVVQTPVRKATLQIPITRLDIEGRGHRYRFALLEMETANAPPPVTSLFGVAAGTRFLHMRTLHFADGHPFVYEDRWLDSAAVPEIAKADFRTMTVNEWLVRNVGYTRGDISFSAEAASASDAEHLDVPIGAALFVVRRATWNERGAITSVRLAHAPGYRMHTTI